MLTNHLCLIRKIKKKWSYTSILTYIVTTWCFVKQWDKFIFSLATAAYPSYTVCWMAKWQWRIETNVRGSGRTQFQGTFPALEWWNRERQITPPECMAGLSTEASSESADYNAEMLNHSTTTLISERLTREINWDFAQKCSWRKYSLCTAFDDCSLWRKQNNLCYLQWKNIEWRYRRVAIDGLVFLLSIRSFRDRLRPEIGNSDWYSWCSPDPLGKFQDITHTRPSKLLPALSY
jgi:hypothetical protein